MVFYFFIPVQFFIMGEGYGYGIQGFTYRYQITTQGVSFIPISYELGYILNGTITGKSVYSILFWIAGSISFAIGITLLLMMYDFEKLMYNKLGSFFLFSSIICTILSSTIQYGPFFFGPAGISVLIGIPVLIILSWFVYTNSEK